MSVSDIDLSAVLLIEFGPLDPDQAALVDLHPLRAVGAQATVEGDGVVVEFALPDGRDVDGLYDDLRGWSIGNALPIRRLVGVA